MTMPALLDTAEELLAGDRGILAMDESIATCNLRFAAAGIEPVTESRRAYRELLVSTPGLAQSIHGAILCDETIRQCQHDGTTMISALIDAAIIPGIELWHGENANVTAAQHALRHRAECDQLARRGEYSPAAERTAA